MTVLLVILGIIMIAGGVGCIFTPLATLLSAGYIIGILFLVYGVIGIVNNIKNVAGPLEWIISILAVIVGVFAIVRPGSTLVIDRILMFMIAAFFVIQGVTHIVLAIQTRGSSGWFIGLIVGILAVALGIYAFINPAIAAITVGVLIGFFFIMCGISMITLGVAANE